MESNVVNCSKCGKSNRLNPEKLAKGLTPKCGFCGSPLSSQTKPVYLTDANFQTVVQGAGVPVLVDFWADWCGPCHMLAPTIEQLASELNGKAIVAKLNVDENQVTASRYGISGIPAILIFSGGDEVDRLVGVQPKQTILARLQSIRVS
jgi:thioredoxin